MKYCAMNIKIIALFLVIKIDSRKIITKNPILTFEPCLGSMLKSTYVYGSQPLGEENQYFVRIDRYYPKGTVVNIRFDSEAIVRLSEGEPKSSAFLNFAARENFFSFSYIANSNFTDFIVKGKVQGVVPYFKNVLINGIEYCHTPIVGYLDDMVNDRRLAMQMKSTVPDHDCGRRKIDFTELIVNGQFSAPGEWPWHAAIFRYEGNGASVSYRCGGIIISKLFVLTAAHCATINNVPIVPDILSVALGRNHLTRADKTSEEREVYSVIVHDDFGSPQHLDNDIALLKLKSEVVFTDYIQPACIWSSSNEKISTGQIIGTVAGWGYSDTDSNAISIHLRHAALPMVSHKQCTDSNLAFYGTKLRNNRKFCAGFGNGTSPCNGDSGGGFMVYGQDPSNDGRRNAGAWYIRGIVSMTLPYSGTKVCDPSQYVLFTDTSKYEDWIRTKAFENNSCKQ